MVELLESGVATDSSRPEQSRVHGAQGSVTTITFALTRISQTGSVGVGAQCGGIQHVDALSRQAHLPRPLEALEQSRDDFVRGAELLGQRPVRGVHDRAVAQQSGGESLIEPLESDSLDQGHQIGQTLGEHGEHEAAKRRFTTPTIEACGVQQSQFGGLRCDAMRQHRPRADGAGGRGDTQLAGRHAVELQRAALCRAARDAHLAGDHYRKASAAAALVEQHGAFGRLDPLHLVRDDFIAQAGIDRGQRRVLWPSRRATSGLMRVVRTPMSVRHSRASPRWRPHSCGAGRSEEQTAGRRGLAS
jgi:hypothetical protein